MKTKTIVNKNKCQNLHSFVTFKELKFFKIAAQASEAHFLIKKTVYAIILRFRLLYKSMLSAETYSEPCQTSKMECLAEVFNG